MADLVCDTSALVALHQIGRLDILQTLGDAVFVPSTVQRELEAGRSLGHDAPDVQALPWITIRSTTTTPPVPNSANLGPGETEVMQLALENPGSVAILDDEPARNAAAQLGILFSGTLGLLIDAKHRGVVPAVAPLLDDLARHHFHMSARLRDTVLRAAGEAP